MLSSETFRGDWSQAVEDLMNGDLSHYFVQIAVWGGVLVVLIAAGVWLTLRFRDSTAEDTLPPSEALTNFQEMRQNGDISDAEFRTIKAVVGAKLRRETKDVDPKGSGKSQQS